MNYSIEALIAQGNGLAYWVDTSGATKLEFFCSPRQPNAALTDQVWKIMRMETDKTTGELIAGKPIKFADGSPDFSHLATSLVVVAAYTYT